MSKALTYTTEGPYQGYNTGHSNEKLDDLFKLLYNLSIIHTGISVWDIGEEYNVEYSFYKIKE